MPGKKRFAQVGLGGRAWMCLRAVLETYADHCEMVGLCDSNEGRLRRTLEYAKSKGSKALGYSDRDFDRMIAEQKPDVVIVTTKDCWHDYYICRAMEMGCDAITEKPMTTDEMKCQRIIDTIAKTGKGCRVTFNYRYAPPATQIKDLLMSGVIGDVFSLDFHWLLDTHHGADYFRRWHRNKENSGGLMVHKATHHFDLINWWLSAAPVSVSAMGHRKFYTPKMADRYGLKNRSERCLDCPEAGKCAFHLDLRTTGHMKELYLDNEEYDGYFRDRCVFSGLIDIEDSMQVIASYNTGVKLSYSLNAFMPWEGHIVSFNGTKGRLEHKAEETVYISGDGTVPGELLAEGTTTRIFPHFKEAYSVEVWQGEGGHGGGDPRLLDDLFSPDPPADKYKRAADQRAGAYSILTGIAANKSMATGQAINIDDLVKGIGLPDYPAMPSPDEPIPMAKEQAKVVSPEYARQLRNKKS